MTDLGYFLAMLAIAGFACCLRDRDLIRAGLVIMANWCAVWAFVKLTGVYDPWAWFALVDGLSLIAVVRGAQSRGPVFIAVIYLAQVALHIAYGSVQYAYGHPELGMEYYRWLAVLTDIQLLCLLVWSVGHGGRRFMVRGNVAGDRAASADVAVSAHRARLERDRQGRS